MAESLGRAEVEIRLQLDKLERDLKSAQTKTQRTSAQMGKGFASVGRKVRGILGPLAALVTAQQFARFAADTARWAQALKTSADNLGLTTGQLQQLHLIAARVGVDFNTIEMAVQRLGRRTGEAVKGTGEALGALRELGILQRIQAGELEGVNDVWRATLVELNKIEDATRRNAIAMKLVDSEGVPAVNALREAYFELEEETSRLVVSEGTLEAITQLRDEGVKSLQVLKAFVVRDLVGAFATWIAKIRESGKALTDLSSGPELQRRLEELQEQRGEIQRQIEEFERTEAFGDAIPFGLGEFIAEGAEEPLRRLRARNDELGAAIDVVIEKMIALGKPPPGIETHGADVKKLESAYTSLKTSIEATFVETVGGAKTLDIFNFGKTLAELDRLEMELAERAPEIRRLREQLIEAFRIKLEGASKEDFDALVEEASELEKAITRDAAAASDDRAAIYRLEYDERLEALQRFRDAGAITEEEYAALVKTTSETLRKTLKDDAKDAAVDWGGAVDSIGDSFADTLSDMVLDADAAFDDILRSFLRLVAQMTLTRAFGAVIDSALGGVTSGVGRLFTGPGASAVTNLAAPSSARATAPPAIAPASFKRAAAPDKSTSEAGLALAASVSRSAAALEAIPPALERIRSSTVRAPAPPAPSSSSGGMDRELAASSARAAAALEVMPAEFKRAAALEKSTPPPPAAEPPDVGAMLAASAARTAAALEVMPAALRKATALPPRPAEAATSRGSPALEPSAMRPPDVVINVKTPPGTQTRAGVDAAGMVDITVAAVQQDIVQNGKLARTLSGTYGLRRAGRTG